MSHLKQLRVKTRIASISTWRVVTKPYYILIVPLGALLASSLILWIPNIELVQYILSSNLALTGKMSFFFSVHRDVLLAIDTFSGLGIILFSFLFGINLTLLIYAIRHRSFQKIPRAGGVGGLFFAIIGGGCIACGTSIITPLLLSVGVTASTAFVTMIGSTLNWLSSILMLYSIYRLALVCSAGLSINREN